MSNWQPDPDLATLYYLTLDHLDLTILALEIGRVKAWAWALRALQ